MDDIEKRETMDDTEPVAAAAILANIKSDDEDKQQ